MNFGENSIMCVIVRGKRNVIHLSVNFTNNHQHTQPYNGKLQGVAVDVLRVGRLHGFLMTQSFQAMSHSFLIL